MIAFRHAIKAVTGTGSNPVGATRMRKSAFPFEGFLFLGGVVGAVLIDLVIGAIVCWAIWKLVVR